MSPCQSFHRFDRDFTEPAGQVKKKQDPAQVAKLTHFALISSHLVQAMSEDILKPADSFVLHLSIAVIYIYI